MKPTALLIGLLLAIGLPGQVEEPKTRAGKARALNEQGVEDYKGGEYQKAVSLFEQARQLDPKNATIGRNLARALHGRAVGKLKANELQPATRDLERALSLDTSEPLFSVVLADVWQRRDQNRRARTVLEKALKRHPDSSHVFEALGRLEYREEFLTRALECLDTAARLDPERAKDYAKFHAKVRREAKVEKSFFKDVKGHFTVKYDDRSFSAVGTAVLDLLDKTYNRLASDFRRWPRKPLTVVLYTRGDYDSATGAHKWTGGLFDGKIRLPVRNYRRAAREIERTLAHELCHWFVREMADVRCPLWLNEGVAQLQEGKKPGGVTRRLITAARGGDRYKKFAALPKSWAGIKDRNTVSLYYAQALHFTDFLVRRYGWSGVSDLLRALKPGVSFKKAFRSAFRWSLADAEEEWLRTLR
ncbi:MAG: hypothetical protein CMJ83_03360 [Planctomycetes bacterium]|nr:hypothetical protein [Planctomycetota bacterium]